MFPHHKLRLPVGVAHLLLGRALGQEVAERRRGSVASTQSRVSDSSHTPRQANEQPPTIE